MPCFLRPLFVIRANQTLIFAVGVQPSRCAIVFRSSTGLQPGKEGTSGNVYKGYAPIPWTDFDCIWPGVSHNHRKTTINLSSCYAYWLMIYGCHKKIDTAPVEPMPPRFQVLHHTQLDTHNR